MTTTPTPERALVALGIAPYQARVLAALIEVGQGDSRELAVASTVPRTSVYAAVEALVEEGLAETVARLGPRAWTVPGHDLPHRWAWVVRNLRAGEERRHADRLAAIDGLRRQLVAA
jgi:DNA-binding IclR family transcriptional regulator